MNLPAARPQTNYYDSTYDSFEHMSPNVRDQFFSQPHVRRLFLPASLAQDVTYCNIMYFILVGNGKASGQILKTSVTLTHSPIHCALN